VATTGEQLRSEFQSDLWIRPSPEVTRRAPGDDLRVVPTQPIPSARYLRSKRAFDIVVSAVVLVLALPLFVAIFLAVKLTSRGPAFYSCERIGRNGRPFRCLKFRTMVADADKSLHLVLSGSTALMQEFERDFKLCRDPRVTPVGRVLRRISLDELPQFWNVLTGDMSVVGWRPIVADEIRRYGDAFLLVASLRPGITGLWQVSGRNNVSYDERVRLDVAYRTRPSLHRDVSIVVRTVTQLVRWWDNGAY
jgi:lipopolysaccharide/colanic/teichoic acid biosynthesis glycosyltransferase